MEKKTKEPVPRLYELKTIDTADRGDTAKLRIDAVSISGRHLLVY